MQYDERGQMWGVDRRVFAEGGANFAYRSRCMRSCGAERRNVTKCCGQNALFLYAPFLLAYVRFLTLVNGSPNPFFFSEPTDSYRASRGCHFLEIPSSVI